ncbi:MAG: TlpA disulfide reductase family protein [Bacteroidota bacterium]
MSKSEKLSLFSVGLCVLLSACQAPTEQFTIDANLTGVADSSQFFLKSLATGDLVDTSLLLNGQLHFRGTLGGPQAFNLYTIEKGTDRFLYTFLFLGNEAIQFEADQADFPWNIDVHGSPHHDIAEQFHQVNHQEAELIKLLREDYQEASKESLQEAISKLVDSLDYVKRNVLKENFNSHAGLFFYKYHKNDFSRKELPELYEKLSPKFQQTFEGHALKTQIEFPPPAVGDAYYDYAGLDQHGDTTSLSSIDDKFILIHISSDGCPYSVTSIPELKALYTSEQDQLEIVEISTDTNQEQWAAAIQEDSIGWTNLFDIRGNYNDAVTKYGTIGTPNYILISPDKMVLAKWFGYKGDGDITEKVALIDPSR